MGYFPFGKESAAPDSPTDPKEMWHFIDGFPRPFASGLYWPAELEAYYRPLLEDFISLRRLSQKILEATLNSHAPISVPEAWHAGQSVLRFIHYHSVPPDRVRMADDHVDYTFLTLHLWANEPGLEIFHDGWQPVELNAQEIAVFPGYLLELATGGRIPALRHRVSKRTNRDRYSCPFLVHPCLEAPIYDLQTGVSSSSPCFATLIRERLHNIGLEPLTEVKESTIPIACGQQHGLKF